MLSSSYSVKYKQLQRQQISHLKDAKEAEKCATDVRSKKLQFETTKRRKQLVIKRKLEQAKEERRRQEILAKRREDINSATERYQRLNKHYTPKSDAEIKAGLLTTTRTPDLEDALQIVRGSPRPSSPSYGQQQYRQGSGGTIRSSVKNHHLMYSPNGGAYNTSMYQQVADSSPMHQHQQQHQSGGMVRTSSQSSRPPSGHGPTPANLQKQIQSINTEKLHDHSLRNVADSRSLFEQQLEQQQRSNVENNQKSLHQFNAALQKELSGKENVRSPDLAIDRQSGSVTSIDSLEQSASRANLMATASANGHTDYYSQKTTSSTAEISQTNGRVVPSPSMYTNSNFGVHRSSNSPTVAVVQPSVVRRSPPETQHGISSNSDPRPYNKHNYDLNGASHTGDHLQDSLEVNYNQGVSQGNKGDKSNLQNFLDRYDYGQPMYSDGKVMYDGAAYQDITVGYANGVDMSYAKPGYNSNGYSTTSQSQRSAGWAIPSTVEISEAAKWDVPQSSGNGNQMSGSSAISTTQPLHSSVSSQAQNGHTAENGYYLHTTKSQQAGSLSGTNGFAPGSKPVRSTQQDRPTPNGHVYTSSHYTATNGAPLESNNSSAHPSSTIGAHPVPHYPAMKSSAAMNGSSMSYSSVNPTTSGPTTLRTNDAHQMYSASGYDSQSKVGQQPSMDGYSNGAHHTANGSYNASAYSTSGPSNMSVAQPVQVSHAITSQNSQISVANTNNSNPVIGTNPTVVQSKSVSYATATTVNTKKPPIPSTQTTTTKPAANPKGNITVPDGSQYNGSNRNVSSVNTRVPTGIPKAVTNTPPKPAVTTNDLDPSRIPRPKNPSFGNKPSLLNEQQSGSPKSQSDEEEEPKAEQPKTAFMEKKSIKGILKKPASASLPRKADSFGVRGEASGKAGGFQRSASAHARVVGPRDSMEVTKQQRQSAGKKRRKKKMVRFTDMAYTNDTETDTEDEEEEEVQEVPVYRNGELGRQQETTAKKPGTRPVSAKVSHQSRMDSSTRGDRASSLGARGKAPSHQPHPPSEPPSGRAVMKIGQSPSRPEMPPTTQHQKEASAAPGGKGLVYSSGRDYTGVDRPAYNGANAPDKPPPEGVYDANGLRLDRTPTDDEINWLWDKVRTCLNKEGSTVSSNGTNGGNGKKPEVNQYRSEINQYNNNSSHMARQSQQNVSNKPPPSGGQHAMNTKYIDGNSLAPQFRAQARIGSAGNRQPGVRKINMDNLNSFSRRAGLLNQRKMKEQNATTRSYNQGEGTSSKAVIQTSVQPLGYQQPVQSSSNPVQGGGQNGYHNDVTESMAAFLAAEQMAGQSVSESEIEAAMQDAQARQASMNSTRPSNKAPSAISLEEQRLMQSLERLNERLKAPETTNHLNVMHHGAFKGHAPLTSHNHPSKRFGSATNIGGSTRGQHGNSSSTGVMYRPTTAMHYRTSNY